MIVVMIVVMVAAVPIEMATAVIVPTMGVVISSKASCRDRKKTDCSDEGGESGSQMHGLRLRLVLRRNLDPFVRKIMESFRVPV